MTHKILAAKNQRQNPTTDTYRLEALPLPFADNPPSHIGSEEILEALSQLFQQTSDQLRNSDEFEFTPTSPVTSQAQTQKQPPLFFISNFSIQHIDKRRKLNVGDVVTATLVTVSDSQELAFKLNTDNVAFIHNALDDPLTFSQNILANIIEKMLHESYHSEGNIRRYFKHRNDSQSI